MVYHWPDFTPGKYKNIVPFWSRIWSTIGQTLRQVNIRTLFHYLVLDMFYHWPDLQPGIYIARYIYKEHCSIIWSRKKSTIGQTLRQVNIRTLFHYLVQDMVYHWLDFTPCKYKEHFHYLVQDMVYHWLDLQPGKYIRNTVPLSGQGQIIYKKHCSIIWSRVEQIQGTLFHYLVQSRVDINNHVPLSGLGQSRYKEHCSTIWSRVEQILRTMFHYLIQGRVDTRNTVPLSGLEQSRY